MNEHLTVRDLISKLQEVENQDAIVVVTSSNFELNHSKIPATGLYLFKGEIKEEGFRDAFDGGNYTTTVIKWNQEGKQEFVEVN